MSPSNSDDFGPEDGLHASDVTRVVSLVDDIADVKFSFHFGLLLVCSRMAFFVTSLRSRDLLVLAKRLLCCAKAARRGSANV